MAVTEGKFNGDIMGIYANGTLVANAQDSSLSVSMDVIDTTEKDSNKWTEHIRGNRAWEISGNSLEVFASSMSVEQLIDFLINADSVTVQFKTTNVDDAIYTGSVSVTATSFSAPQNAPAAFDFTFVGNGTLSKGTEAADVIARMSALTQTEINAITTYVNAEVAVDNFSKLEEIYCLSLNSTDALVGFKTKSGGLINAPSHSLNGYDFNGTTQAFNTNWTPSLDQLSDNLFMGAFVFSVGTIIDKGSIFGAGEGGAVNFGMFIRNDGVLSSVRYQNNSTLNSGTVDATIINDKSLLVTARVDSSNHLLYDDGVQADTDARAQDLLADDFIFIGASTVNGTSVSNPWKGEISFWATGQAIGFNHSAHNTNVRNLLTNLGLTL